MRDLYVPACEPAVRRHFDATSIELDRVAVLRLVVRSPHLVAYTEAGSVGAERFRALSLRVRNFQKYQQLKKILITSSIKGEGKSIVSANLAFTLAQQRQRVLLLDGDLHQSGLCEILATHHLPGLTDWWNESGSIMGFLRRIDGLSLWYLPAGPPSGRPMEILQAQRFTEMLNDMAACFDTILIDSPPLAPVADSNFLSGLADGTLLVVRQGRTPKSLLKEALTTETLKPIGIVANEWNDVRHRYYSSYYKPYSAGSEEHRRISAPSPQSDEEIA